MNKPVETDAVEDPPPTEPLDPPKRNPREGWAEASAMIAIAEADDPERDAWIDFDDPIDED